MSLQPLRITGGTKFAAGLAGILTTTSMGAGCAITALALLTTVPSEPLSSTLLFLALALLTSGAFVAVSHLLVRAALGRHRTGGSLTRFFRYQLGALGVGGGLGLGFFPAMIGAAPIWWAVSITAGIALCGVSLLAFRRARYRILDRPPHPHIGLAEAVVVDYWSGAMPRGAAPSLTVIRFTDESGRARWVRHLVAQPPSMLGTMGQVQYDRRRPERVLRFTVGHRRSAPPPVPQPPNPPLWP
ncbi:MAG: hypothetical protein ACTH2U_17730 [Brevibacterium sp.]